MDFQKALETIDELLYEAMVVLVFFPRTLWLILRYPQRMMDYADTELGDVLSEQYDDTLSPTLFLAICIGLNYAIARMINGAAANDGLPTLLQDWQHLLTFRIFAFSLFPLLMALRVLRGQREPLNRGTLRPPFYSQCFVTGPFALVSGMAQSLYGAGWLKIEGLTLALVLILGWYLTQQTLWFRSQLGTGILRSAAIATGMMALAVLLILLFGIMLSV